MVVVDSALDTRRTDGKKGKCSSWSIESLRTSRRLRSSSRRRSISRFCRDSSSIGSFGGFDCDVWPVDGGDGEASDNVDDGFVFTWFPFVSLEDRGGKSSRSKERVFLTFASVPLVSFRLHVSSLLVLCRIFPKRRENEFSLHRWSFASYLFCFELGLLSKVQETILSDFVIWFDSWSRRGSVRRFRS